MEISKMLKLNSNNINEVLSGLQDRLDKCINDIVFSRFKIKDSVLASDILSELKHIHNEYQFMWKNTEFQYVLTVPEGSGAHKCVKRVVEHLNLKGDETYKVFLTAPTNASVSINSANTHVEFFFKTINETQDLVFRFPLKGILIREKLLSEIESMEKAKNALDCLIEEVENNRYFLENVPCSEITIKV